jgi:hypothetical protein
MEEYIERNAWVRIWKAHQIISSRPGIAPKHQYLLGLIYQLFSHSSSLEILGEGHVLLTSLICPNHHHRRRLVGKAKLGAAV